MNKIITDEWQKEVFPANLADSLEYQKWVNEGKKAIANIFEEKEKNGEKKYIYQNENLRNLEKNEKDEEKKSGPMIIKKITDHYENLGLDYKYIQRIYDTTLELAQNGLIHGDQNYPVKVNIYEKREINNETKEDTPYIYIEVINKIHNETTKEKEEVEKFKEKLNKVNYLSIEELKTQYKEEMRKWWLTEKWTGSLWFRQIWRKIKINDDEKPLTYEQLDEKSDNETISRCKVTCKINASKMNIPEKIGISNTTEVQITTTPVA
jgi:hypothetical protein